ncbi:MAG: hypothetical protein AB7V50_04445 [Vampirovibrionia bacterium]
MSIDFCSFDFAGTTSILFLGTVVASSVFGFIGNININSGGGNVNINGSEAEMEIIKEQSEEISAEGLKNLLITNPVGDVSISSTNESVVKVKKVLKVPKATSEEERKSLVANFEKTIFVKNDTNLDITVPHMSVMGVMSVSVDLVIMLPASINVKQNAGVNNITVENLNGAVELQNNVGNIKLSSLSGPVNVHTNSGSINASGLKEPRSITANAGNILLSSFDIPDGNLNIVSQVGKIELDVISVAKSSNCVIKSSTGTVLLVIDRSAAFSLEASTCMGKLDIDPAINAVQKGQSFMGGAVTAEVNGSGGKISAMSNTGSVTVTLK